MNMIHHACGYVLAVTMAIGIVAGAGAQPKPAEAGIDALVAVYCAAWNEIDPEARGKLLQQVWADDGVFVDPTSDVVGREALSQAIAGFQKQFPGARIEMASRTDRHHDVIRFSWRAIGADGATLIEGIDFGELDDQGRLRKIVGFWGPLPDLQSGKQAP